MKQEIVKYMIDNEFIKKNSLINATIRVHGLGGQPVILEKNILFEEWAESTKGALYIKGCDPENLKTMQYFFHKYGSEDALIVFHSQEHRQHI